MTEKLNIALLAGGDSSEREISLKSASQVAVSMNVNKYHVYAIDINGINWSYTDKSGSQFQVDKNDFSLTIDGEKVYFECALILIHGTPGEDGKLQGYLDMMGIPYPSCGMVSSVITFDKYSCKRIVEGAGINLAKEVLLRKNDPINSSAIIDYLKLPLFVKPNASGSSFGVTKVKFDEELVPAIEAAFKESDAVLSEEYIDGREMGCGVMITREKEYVFPITEIISTKEFFDYEAKYTANLAAEITPADIDIEVKNALNQMSLSAYKACNCRGVVRIDFIVTKDNVPYMIEINAIPGMSEGSIVPKQAKEMGLSLGDIYDITIEDTI